MDNMGFLSSVVEQNHSATIKLLDTAIKAALEHRDTGALVNLYLNRGLCNQKLQLYRKALKVGGVWDGDSTAPGRHNTAKAMGCSQGARVAADPSVCVLGVWPACVPQDYEEAISLKPNCTKALYRKGAVLAALKKFEVCLLSKASCFYLSSFVRLMDLEHPRLGLSPLPHLVTHTLPSPSHVCYPPLAYTCVPPAGGQGHLDLCPCECDPRHGLAAGPGHQRFAARPRKGRGWAGFCSGGLGEGGLAQRASATRAPVEGGQLACTTRGTPHDTWYTPAPTSSSRGVSTAFLPPYPARWMQHGGSEAQQQQTGDELLHSAEWETDLGCCHSGADGWILYTGLP